MTGEILKVNGNSLVISTNAGPQRFDKVCVVEIVSKEANASHEATAPAVLNINVRFSIIADLVKLVCKNQIRGLVVSGSGGLGKTHTVMATINEHGDSKNVVVVKGYSSPRSLFNTLRDNASSVIVFDDCDSVLNDVNAVNILKSAIDTSPVRIVSWLTARGDDDTFRFDGRIIFISNQSLVDVPQPILSRTLFVDVTMSQEEKLERLETILPSIPGDMIHKQETLKLIRSLLSRVSDLNIRTFTKVLAIRTSGLTNWLEIATYVLTTEISRSR